MSGILGQDKVIDGPEANISVNLPRRMIFIISEEKSILETFAEAAAAEGAHHLPRQSPVSIIRQRSHAANLEVMPGAGMEIRL